MKDYKFIAGAICPACGEKDSIVLKNDDSQIRCIACNFYQNKDKCFEPLKVTGDALPWQLFRETKEIEDCTIDKDGFDYCLIKPIYDENIKKYNGETVTIMGYMFPLEESEKQKKFLMGPYPLSCPFHYHVGPSQVIEIKSDNPVDFSFDPITIKGKLKVKYNKETGSFFYLETINS